jgi:hypothetical protein
MVRWDDRSRLQRHEEVGQMDVPTYVTVILVATSVTVMVAVVVVLRSARQRGAVGRASLNSLG